MVDKLLTQWLNSVYVLYVSSCKWPLAYVHFPDMRTESQGVNEVAQSCSPEQRAGVPDPDTALYREASGKPGMARASVGWN